MARDNVRLKASFLTAIAPDSSRIASEIYNIFSFIYVSGVGIKTLLLIITRLLLNFSQNVDYGTLALTSKEKMDGMSENGAARCILYGHSLQTHFKL